MQTLNFFNFGTNNGYNVIQADAIMISMSKRKIRSLLKVNSLFAVKHGVIFGLLRAFDWTSNPSAIFPEIQYVNVIIGDSAKCHDERTVLDVSECTQWMIQFVLWSQSPLNGFGWIFSFQCSDIEGIKTLSIVQIQSTKFEQLKLVKFGNEIDNYQGNVPSVLISSESGNEQFVC